MVACRLWPALENDFDTCNRMTLTIQLLLDLATQTGRRCAILPPDFAAKMQRRLRRKFKVKLELDTIVSIVEKHVTIYRFAAAALRECLIPNNDIYASLSHVDDPKWMDKLAAQFPDEDPKILDEIANWVVQYEYLR